MKSFFAALAYCGLGLSLNTPIGIAAEWEPVNTDLESNSTTRNQVDSGRSTQWSPVESKSETSTNTNRQVVWKSVEPARETVPSQPNWVGIDTETNVKDPIRWKPVEPAIAQEIEDDIDNEQPIKDASVKNVAIKPPMMPSGATFANDKALWRDDTWHPQISSLVPVGFGPKGLMFSGSLYGWDCIPAPYGPCKHPGNLQSYVDEIESRAELDAEGTIGFGDAEKLLGISVVGMSSETDIRLGNRNLNENNSKGLLSEYYVGANLSRNLGPDTAVKVGIKNWLDVRPEKAGESMRAKSFYGVLSQRIRLKENQRGWLPNLYLTAGIGNGEFRSASKKFQSSVAKQREAGCHTYGFNKGPNCSEQQRARAGARSISYGEPGPIGSIALEIYPGFNLIGEWVEGNLKAGFSVKPLNDLGLVFTSMWGSLLHNCDWGCKVPMQGVPGGVELEEDLITERVEWSAHVSLNMKF